MKFQLKISSTVGKFNALNRELDTSKTVNSTAVITASSVTALNTLLQNRFTDEKIQLSDYDYANFLIRGRSVVLKSDNFYGRDDQRYFIVIEIENAERVCSEDMSRSYLKRGYMEVGYNPKLVTVGECVPDHPQMIAVSISKTDVSHDCDEEYWNTKIFVKPNPDYVWLETSNDECEPSFTEFTEQSTDVITENNEVESHQIENDDSVFDKSAIVITRVERVIVTGNIEILQRKAFSSLDDAIAFLTDKTGVDFSSYRAELSEHKTSSFERREMIRSGAGGYLATVLYEFEWVEKIDSLDVDNEPTSNTVETLVNYGIGTGYRAEQ